MSKQAIFSTKSEAVKIQKRFSDYKEFSRAYAVIEITKGYVIHCTTYAGKSLGYLETP